MADIIGYAALTLNLLSMTMKNVLYLRALSICANSMYIAYGIALHAAPFVIGCTIAVIIHVYHVRKLCAAR